VGAAAYYGNTPLLKRLIEKKGGIDLNFKAIEHVDALGKGPLVKEFHGYTPLLLAIAGGDRNLDCVKALLDAKVETTLKDSY